MGFDLATGTIALPWWAAAAAGALVAALVVLSVFRTGGQSTVGAVARVFVAALALMLGWSYFDRLTVRDRADERRALDIRASQFTLQATAAGSALSCLDALAGDTIEEACEKAVFASPESVAAASSYVAARLTLLADATDLMSRGEPGYDRAVALMRRAVEIDRFGVVAHVLELRDKCTADECDALALVQDTSRVIGNLRDKTFDGLVTRHAADWTKSSPVATAPASVAPPAFGLASSAPNAPNPEQPTSAIFPTASSIPPVSIMNNEPGMPGQNGVEAQAKADPKTPLPTPRPARRNNPNSTAARAAPAQPAETASQGQ